MLQATIRFALGQRLLVMAVAAALLAYGAWSATTMPIDVFPDLNRPRVVVLTEAPGLAPEEVESLVTLQIETAVQGAGGVEAVRSQSSFGLSVVYVEFEFDVDVQDAWQLISGRMQTAADRLPEGVTPQLAPISSILGQVLMLGMWSDDPAVDPMRLRTLADWVVRPRLLSVPGVAQVFAIGGEVKQFQVLLDPQAMLRYGVTLQQVEAAVEAANENGSGGYLDAQGPNELLVRSIGRIGSLEDLRTVPVGGGQGRPVVLSQVAEVREGPAVQRGDASAFVRSSANAVDTANAAVVGPDARWSGGPAVVMMVNKQPGADTRAITEEASRAIEGLRASLPPGVRLTPLYTQASFIDRAIENVAEALRDGGILVALILFLFLLNLRTAFITLTAIPLSLAVTAGVFAAFGLSINTMTLGGIAVAMGELVDDAIVDVENIFRRLRENRALSEPRPPLRVVYEASNEVRRSIVFGTGIVMLSFIPLLGLGGMEGRLFVPLALAYVVSILASLLVSLTVTPVLSYWLLSGGKSAGGGHERDSLVLRGLKTVMRPVIAGSLRAPYLVLGLCGAAFAAALAVGSTLDRDFLPPFDEGAIQLNVVLPPGVSLKTSNEIAATVERSLRDIPDVQKIARRTGRAEMDEHAEGVNMSEMILEMDPDSPLSRGEQLAAIRSAMDEVTGVVTATEQPLAHLISHMLSGVKADVAVKIFGDDLDTLRRAAEQVKGRIAEVPGATDVLVEPQTLIPQLRIEWDRERLLLYGLSVGEANRYVQTAMNGRAVSQVLEGVRSFDLVVRLNRDYREDIDALRRLSIETPAGVAVTLGEVAEVYETGGPNMINRDDVRRRIVVQCNVAGRGVVDVVGDIREAIAPLAADLPPGYFVEYGGQAESQREASRAITLLFAASLAGIFVLLLTLFRTVNLALQVMVAIPMAFVGGVAALAITGQTLTIAALVGFISLAGIASRNGILLLQHYTHLVQHEGEGLDAKMIVRAGLERLAPVLMTALTSSIALVPLVWAAAEPGKEIIYPVATVILGGLISSTAIDFLLHPALFYLFGMKSLRRSLDDERAEAVLG